MPETEENKNRNSNLFRSEYEKHMLHMIVLDKNEFIHISDQQNGRELCTSSIAAGIRIGFLILPDFSSNQMHEYLIRVKPIERNSMAKFGRTLNRRLSIAGAKVNESKKRKKKK